jgi:hypothetical protein
MEANIEILKFIQPEILILIPVLSILGLMIKKNPTINDWAIPIILLFLGIVFSILILGLKSGFTPDVFLNGLLQGVLATGMAVYVHQLKIQSSRKR